MSAPEGWEPLLEKLEPHVSPDWVTHAREHGGQAWVRLILLVDAHAQLCNPRVAEKVAMTMAELADGREREVAGWQAVQEKARDDRMELVAELVDVAPGLLSDDLAPLFGRSIEPAVHTQ